MNYYKPYTPEWHRRRELKDSIYRYFDSDASIDVVFNDIMDILNERSEKSYTDFCKISDLENRLHISKNLHKLR